MSIMNVSDNYSIEDSTPVGITFCTIIADGKKLNPRSRVIARLSVRMNMRIFGMPRAVFHYITSPQ